MFSPPADKKAAKAAKNQNINVFVRVRPLNKQETGRKGLTQVQCNGSRDIVVHERASDKFTKTFTFDRVFGPTSKQLDVYRSVVSPLIEEVLQGYNCTVFAYGQTGTGKTYTMEGERTLRDDCKWEEDPRCGIVPRALSQVFDDLRVNKTEFTLRVSFLELYNEEIFDLLSPCDDTTKLRLFEDSTRKGSVIIQGLEEVMVHSKDELHAILEKGTLKRQTAATLMNAHSSRSHTIFSLTIHMKENTIGGEQLLKTGKLNLVDLAGSENIGRSGAMDKRAREAGSINQSLLTLGRVITALVEKTPHVPYRESKLTRLLQDSLGGKTRTSIIATVSPSSCCLDETLSTLDYAHRAKNITNRPEINQKLAQSVVLKEFSETIERLQRDLMAAREKNGIYLAQENYSQMTSEIQQQSQELAEKIQTVRALRDELEQKEALFIELRVTLNDCEEELEGTKLTLDGMRKTLNYIEQKLSSTLSELNLARKDAEEKSVLVEEHSRTEKILTGQATHLVEVADTATAHLEKLHTKLDRHITLEDRNLKSAVDLKTTLREDFEAMQCKMNNFSSEIISVYDDMHALSVTQLKHNEEASTQLCAIFSACTEKICSTLSSMQTDILNQLHSNKQLTERSEEILISCFKTHDLILKSYVSDTVHQAAKVGGALCDKLQFQTDNMLAKIKQKLDQHSAIVRDSEAQQNKTACDIKQIVNSHLTEQRHIIGLVHEQTDTEERGDIDDMRKRRSFAKRLKDLVTEFEEDNDNIEQCKKSKKCKVRELLQAETVQTLVTQEKIDKSVDSHQQNCRSSGINMMASAADVLHILEEEMENVRSLVSDTRKQWKSLSDDTERFTNSMDHTLSVTEDKTKSFVEEFCQKSSENIHQYINVIEDLNQTLKRTLAEHADYMSCLNVEWSEQSSRSCNLLHRVFTSSNGFVNDLGTEMNVWYDRICDADIAVDEPTGETPRRQTWKYPVAQELAATSPHERILQRLHSKKAEHSSSAETVVESVQTRGEQSTPFKTCIESAGTLRQAATSPPDKENMLHSTVSVQVPKKGSVDPKGIKKRILQQQQN